MNGLLNTGNYTDVYNTLKEDQTNNALPRAYLNYQVFDNSMRLVPSQSGAIQVGGTQGSWQDIGTQAPITIGQSGYILIYISNEQLTNVDFDQVDIHFYKGRVLQEQHYYPYGLSIKAGETTGEKNHYKFEGNEKLDELGLQLYDFNARQYDPQIGRFWSVDPLADYGQERFSPYHFTFNNPANFADPSGLQGDPAGTRMGGASEYSSFMRGRTYSAWMGYEWGNYPQFVLIMDGGGKGGFTDAFYNQNYAIADAYSNSDGTFSYVDGTAVAMPGAGQGVKNFVSKVNFGGHYERLNSNSSSKPMYVPGVGYTYPDQVIVDRWVPATRNSNPNFARYLNSLTFSEPKKYIGSPFDMIGTGGAGALLKVGKAIGGLLKSGKGTYSVYQGIDKTTRAVKYIGITKRNPLVRFGEHARSGQKKHYSNIM